MVGEAIEVIETIGEHRWEPEVYRLKGQMLLGTNGSRLEAETAFKRSVQVAHEQGARWFELRSATSLASLWHKQGNREEARDLLSPIYGWFTEGFDTPDLEEAKTLLDALS